MAAKGHYAGGLCSAHGCCAHACPPSPSWIPRFYSCDPFDFYKSVPVLLVGWGAQGFRALGLALRPRSPGVADPGALPPLPVPNLGFCCLNVTLRTQKPEVGTFQEHCWALASQFLTSYYVQAQPAASPCFFPAVLTKPGPLAVVSLDGGHGLSKS